MKWKGPVTIIRRSCLTGKVVWIYRGPTQSAARKAYERACKKEVELVENWGEVVRQHTESVGRLIDLCTAALRGKEPTPRQAEALRELKAEMDRPPVCYTEFYDHIIEMRRRRAEDREIRRKMRERENAQNRDYDKRK